MRRFLLISMVLLLFTGCFFSHQYRGVAFFEGVPYYMPVESIPIMSIKENSESFKDFNCKEGDVLWVSKYDKYKFDEIVAKQDTEAFIQMINDNLLGCTSPMSKAEFKYRMQEMKVKASNPSNGLVDGINTWAKAMESNADAYRQMQNDNTLNSINRNLQDINRNLNYGTSRRFYNPMPIYP